MGGRSERRLRIVDIGRLNRYDAFKSSLATAKERLNQHPDDIDARITLAEWYEFRGMHDWARTLFEEARRRGSRKGALSAARTYIALGDDLVAGREYRLALKNGEAPADYIEMCLNGIKERQLRLDLGLPP